MVIDYTFLGSNTPLPFHNGQALIQADAQYSHKLIDRLGRILPDSAFKPYTEKSEELERINFKEAQERAEAQKLKVDLTKYDYYEPFSEGVAVVKTDDGKYGFLDQTGKMAIKARFTRARSFREGLAEVYVGGYFKLGTAIGKAIDLKMTDNKDK